MLETFDVDGSLNVDLPFDFILDLKFKTFTEERKPCEQSSVEFARLEVCQRLFWWQIAKKMMVQVLPELLRVWWRCRSCRSRLLRFSLRSRKWLALRMQRKRTRWVVGRWCEAMAWAPCLPLRQSSTCSFRQTDAKPKTRGWAARRTGDSSKSICRPCSILIRGSRSWQWSPSRGWRGRKVRPVECLWSTSLSAGSNRWFSCAWCTNTRWWRAGSRGQQWLWWPRRGLSNPTGCWCRSDNRSRSHHWFPKKKTHGF